MYEIFCFFQCSISSVGFSVLCSDSVVLWKHLLSAQDVCPRDWLLVSACLWMLICCVYMNPTLVLGIWVAEQLGEGQVARHEAEHITFLCWQVKENMDTKKNHILSVSLWHNRVSLPYLRLALWEQTWGSISSHKRSEIIYRTVSYMYISSFFLKL